MKINKSGYDSMDWASALSKSKQPIKDQEAHAISKIGKGEDVDNALQKAAEAAFSLPSNEKMTNAEAIKAASKNIQDERAESMRQGAIDDVKAKLANHDVDPVGLGLVTKAEWDNCPDVETATQIGRAAATKRIQNQNDAWQNKAMEPQNRNMKFDPESSRDGRISSTAAAMEDSAPIVTRRSPLNAPSIFDPFKLDRLAAEQNEHDEAIRVSREAAKQKAEARKDWREASNTTVPEDFMPLHGGAISRSGGKDSSVFSSKVPKNQVSMMDNIPASGASADTVKEEMKKLFESKVEDNGQRIKEANKARSESIQRPVEKEDKKSWEKVSKPVSTKDLQARLVNLWLPPEPGK